MRKTVKQEAVQSFDAESLKKSTNSLEAPYLSHMLAHQEEVVPIPPGDCVVHYCPRGRIFKVSTSS
jgi:hypothetical protein